MRKTITTDGKIQRHFEHWLFILSAFIYTPSCPQQPQTIHKNNTAQYEYEFQCYPSPIIFHDGW